jgi:radical SAM superfamily enzyme YgiQ (UPF0313 family)
MSEGELVLPTILDDAVHGELQPVYGNDQRWQQELEAPIVNPPNEKALRRYLDKSCGCYPVRGCPYSCKFCSVIKIAGQVVRSQPIWITLESLKRAKAAGVRSIVFTADNFNKYSQAPELLQAMIDEKLNLPFFVQCDTQVLKQPGLIEHLGRAGCAHMFLGVESFDRRTLLKVHKAHNHPEDYAALIGLCHENGIQVNGSFVLGFDHDRRDVFERTAEWIEQNRLECATFHILTPYPATPLFRQMASEGRLIHRDWSRYDTAHAVFRPKHMEPEELEQGYGWLYERLFSHTSIWKRRPDDWRAVAPYLAMSYLYKRSNRFWHLLIKHNAVHAVWSPLVELTRLRHLRYRAGLAESAVPMGSPGQVVSAGV